MTDMEIIDQHEERFGKINLINSAIVIGKKDMCVSLHIPQLKSVLIVRPGSEVPDIPETDFSKSDFSKTLNDCDFVTTFSTKNGIVDGDLYYVTVPIGSDIYIGTQDGKRVIIECTKNGIKEITI